MKRITDSLLKRIVRQSLNESYGLLNEDKTYPTGPVEVDGVILMQPKTHVLVVVFV